IGRLAQSDARRNVVDPPIPDFQYWLRTDCGSAAVAGVVDRTNMAAISAAASALEMDLIMGSPCCDDVRGRSPLRVLRKNVISVLDYRVAPEPAFGFVSLRWFAGFGTRLEGLRSGVVVEHGIAPSAAVRESLAVFDHEVDVVQGAWYRRVRERLQFFRVPVDFRHLGAVWDRFAVCRNSFLVGFDHHGIGEAGGFLG